jgi:inosine-uridine nucleoside N-ribohydrolase
MIMRQKLILDVDTGTDDAVALMTAALAPELDLIGATTVNGNTLVQNCTENTLRVFDYIGKNHIPVFEGMSRPLTRDNAIQEVSAEGIHGDFLELPPSRTKKQHQHAVDWLIETYMQSAGDIILVPVGPLTNIAAAIRKEPRILPKIPELVIMGGAHEHGNSTPSAEFNIWLDPEAAKIVVNCGRPIRMIPLDATHRALVSREDCSRLRTIGTPAAIATAVCTERRISGYDKTQPMHRLGAAPVHDALAVCAIIDPTVVKTQFINVDVETKGALTDGRTVCDFRHRSLGAPNVHFATDADEPKFVRMLMDILGRTA